MKFIKLTLAVLLAAGLSACASVEQVTRTAPAEFAVSAAPQTSFNVQSVKVTVARDLSVSEANRYYPVADIVWRGDLPGDRHQQVADMFQTGMDRGARALKGQKNVVVDIDVLRFHSLTEKARYSVGGVHSIKFAMTVFDAETGEIIVDRRLINADLDAFGGRKALAAERRGLTQKVRITSHLAGVLQREMTLHLLDNEFVEELPAVGRSDVSPI